MPTPGEEAYILREAAAFAQVIVAWHSEIGLRMAPSRMVYDGEPRLDSLDEYRSTVSRVMNSDLRTLGAQAEVANIQLCGTFEWFFHEVIPESLWRRFADHLPFRPPTHLHEAARHIQHLHKQIAAMEDSKAEPLRVQESGRGTIVRYSSRNELQSLARKHYAPYLGEEHIGIGGANFLLSSSLERSVDQAAESGEITLLTPEYLGFAIQPSADNDLLSRLRAGEVRIESLEGF